MQPDAPITRVEDDFWASQDRKSSLFNWKFPDPPHTGAIAAVFSSASIIHWTAIPLLLNWPTCRLAGAQSEASLESPGSGTSMSRKTAREKNRGVPVGCRLCRLFC
jgi:hypothetical protein